MPTAVLFPGQGSALAGAKELAERHCPDLYERCVLALDVDPFESAAESTAFAQPAIFLASIAGWRSLADAELQPCAFAGHSLGELSALTAAGVLAETDALDLVVLRARLMADAGGDGGMLALLKGALEDADELARAHGLTIANDNAAGQTVLSGPRGALRDAAVEARRRGLRAIALDVAGAFHSPAMAPAVEPFKRAVREVRLSAPSAPVFSGMTARRFRNVPVELAGALCAPVRWRETQVSLGRIGADTFIDAGPDEVLARLTERNLPDSTVLRREELLATA